MKKEAFQTERMIHVRLSNEVHRALRIKAAKEDMSIQELVAAIIEKYVASELEEKEGK